MRGRGLREYPIALRIYVNVRARARADGGAESKNELLFVHFRAEKRRVEAAIGKERGHGGAGEGVRRVVTPFFRDAREWGKVRG